MRHNLNFVFMLILSLTITVSANSKADQSKILQAGTPAKKFLIKDLNGKRIGLRDFVGAKAQKSGKAHALTLVSYWSLSCVPCRKEMPLLVSFAAKHPQKVALVFINLDSRKESPKIKPFLKEHNVGNATVLLDIYQTAGKNYGVCENNSCSVPALFGIDSTGKIQFSRSGFEDEKEFMAFLESQISGAPAKPALPTTAAPQEKLNAKTKFQILHSALKSVPLKEHAAKYGITPPELISIFKEIEALAKEKWIAEQKTTTDNAPVNGTTSQH